MWEACSTSLCVREGSSMSCPELVVREAYRWLRFSAEDLDVARRLLTDCPPVPRHVCWLAQQSAEKALKAALVLEEVEFPFSHDLDALRNLLPYGWRVHVDHPDLAELTEWAVETRYPGEWPETTEAEATRAESQARAVHDSVATEFRCRGIRTEASSLPKYEDRLDVTSNGDLAVVVAAHEKPFNHLFLGQGGEHCWHEIPIAPAKLAKIKYIAAYRIAPVSAVTHCAPVDRIEPYFGMSAWALIDGEGYRINGEKYKLVFSEPAREIGPIPKERRETKYPQGPRYTTMKKLKCAKTLADLW